MQSSMTINAGEEQWLLQGMNETQTLWTARLVHVSGFQWCKKDTFASQYSNVTVTVVPTFMKENNSYKQVPKSKFCGTQQVHLAKRDSQVLSSQDEVSQISPEECLQFSLLLKNDLPALACVLIHEHDGEYLYTYPPTFEISKLREIVDHPCKNVLERMLLFTTSAIVHRELESLTSLYNYCENTPLLHPTPTIIGDIALLTALQLVGVTEAEVPPQNNSLSPVENLASRLIDRIVAHAESKFRPKHSSQLTVRNFLGNSKPIVSFYTTLDSALFCPLRLKMDANVLYYSTLQLVTSFIWFLVMFPIYGSRKIIRCDKNFFRPGHTDNFYQPTTSRWFVFLSYFSLLLSVASIVVYYVSLRCGAADGVVQIWIPSILAFFTLVFAHMNVGAIHHKFSIPHFTSVKLSHDKAQVVVLRQNQRNRMNADLIMNDHTDRDAENREPWSVNFDISWIRREYMNKSAGTVLPWYMPMVLLFLMAPASQITLFELYRSKKLNVTMPCFMNSSVSAALIYSANVITTESTAIVLVICASFYFNAYSMIQGILAKVQENDYNKQNVSNEFAVRKPESLEYLLTVIRVMIGSTNHSLPHMIIIGCTVLVLFSLTFITLINYIQFHSIDRISVPGCIIYTITLAVPSIIILIKIALINNMVTRNLLAILQDNQQRLINQIVKEKSLAMRGTDTAQSSAVDPIPNLIIARDYLHDQINLLTNQGEINTIKLFGFLPINLPLLISIGLTAGGSVAAYLLSTVKGL